ncbi:winged helix-turn-helix domain-containing protein [Vibrio cholerae]|nr:winged helix-turn-helix domain-containing protein [Vibrio cholerae]MBD1196679.1 winged helix-turn-helix domain-containing protein [Vibrio cholerae]
MLRNYLLGNQVIFDTLKREVLTTDKIISLGGREAAILKLLCENANTVITKEEINDKVWGKVFVSETSLTKAISNLRKSLQLIDGVMCEIKTIPKEGYMLILEGENLGLMVTEDEPPLEVKRIESKDLAMIKAPAANHRFLPALSKTEENTYSGYIKPSWLLLAVFSSALISSFASAGMVLLLK